MPSVLHTEVVGDGPTIVLAHGFTQTARLWGRFGELVTGARRAVFVDLPGHGGSSEVRADLEEGGAMVVAAAGEGPFDLVGYSIGARFALHAALGAPGRVRRLVLLGATGGIEDDQLRAERRRRDEATADALEDTGDVAAFVDSWLAAPMFATLRGADAGAAERRANSAAGLASSLRLAGAGTQSPLWGRLGELEMPVLAIAGATDLRYQEHALRIASLVARGTFAVIPGAGHATHLEQPGTTGVVVAHWLAATEEAGD